MDKREFLKASGTLLTSTLLSRYAISEEHASGRTNWSGNWEYHARQLETPASAEELQHLIKRGSTLKALGSRHSFNSIADTTGDQISLKHLDSMTLDAKAGTVTVGAGIRYGDLAPWLDSRGYALHNLASLPHISVAGACATATHGSGIQNKNLSAAVEAIEMVTPDGQIVHLSREKDGDHFPGTVVGLGGLGIVTKATLRIEPTYQVSQVVYQDLSFAHLEHHLDEIFSSGYSVSLFTDWQNRRASEVWIKSRVPAGGPVKAKREFFGAKLATRKLHPIVDHPAEAATDQLGIPGPWYERLPHFRMNFTPSSGAELQSEYLIPREHGYRAILAVEELRDHITPHLFITELRTIAADDLWMSSAYQRDSMAIHFTWKPEWPAVKTILPMIEEKLAPFQARPHWAKLFTMQPERLQSLYPRLSDYQKLLKHYDPSGKFRNAFLNTNIYGA